MEIHKATKKGGVSAAPSLIVSSGRLPADPDAPNTHVAPVVVDDSLPLNPAVRWARLAGCDGAEDAKSDDGGSCGSPVTPASGPAHRASISATWHRADTATPILDLINQGLTCGLIGHRLSGGRKWHGIGFLRCNGNANCKS
jgi:hypothetical protein